MQHFKEMQSLKSRRKVLLHFSAANLRKISLILRLHPNIFTKCLVNQVKGGELSIRIELRSDKIVNKSVVMK